MQSAVDPMLVIDDRGIIVDLNPATLETFQYERDELVGNNVSILMKDHDAGHHNGYIRNYLDSGKARIIGKGREVFARRKDGSLITCYLAVADLEVDGKTYFTGIIRNLQPETDARNNLEYSYQALTMLNDWANREDTVSSDKIDAFLQVLNGISNADIVLFIPDAANPYFNIPWYCLTDSKSISEAQKQDILECIAREYRHSKAAVELVDSNSIAHRFPELTASLKKLLVSPISSGDQWLGNILLAWSQSADTETVADSQNILRTCLNSFAEYLGLRLTVSELAIANDRFYRSQTASNIGTWDWDINSGQLYWSQQIGPLFGYRPGELKTSYENFMAAVHPQDRERVQNAVNACINDNQPYDIDHRVVWPDGTIHWVNEKGNVERDRDGNPLKMLGVVQDINRAKRAEEHLLKATLHAEQANRAKSEFLSLISHELRTPLNSILGFAQLINQQKLENNLNLYSQQIIDSGKILLKLVNDILDFNRIENNQIDMQIEAVDLDELAKQCLQMLGEQAKSNGVTLEHISNGKHPLVQADPVRLKQVLLNLISNAIKYNRKGGSVKVKCEVREGHTLRATVQDTGHGIPPERRHEIFQPFSRLDFKNSAIEGAGIGLLITKQLTEKMGGSIDFISDPGQGSIFWVDMPLTESARREEYPTEEVKVTQDSRELEILYVEDNPSNTALMQSLMQQQENYQLIQAITATEGLELARKHRPGVIIMDINLPDFDGIEACRRLKQDPETRHIPVIALTADFARKSEKLADNHNFFRIIFKPFDIGDLLNTVNAAAQCHNASDTPPIPDAG